MLGTSSGFQSAQFRELEYRLGIKDPKFLEFLRRRQRGACPAGKRAGRTVAVGRGQCGAGARRLSIEGEGALKDAWLEIYRRPDEFFGLYQLAEKLVDLDDALAAWRHKHMLTVERIIGMKKGTGGSAGAAYLASTLSQARLPRTVVPEDCESL